MGYHIDTGLIKDKFKEDCNCPLCEIKKIVEEQFLHEFLNDAVMEDSTREKVNKLGFCERHFNMLLSRPNKLSVALQAETRCNFIKPHLLKITNISSAKKAVKNLEQLSKTCIVCDLTQQSMVKYYKTVAQLFVKEKSFYKSILSCKGFCIEHYAQLLKYAKHAGFMAKEYISLLSSVQERTFSQIQEDLHCFCLKHDYRNANVPLGNAETSLPRIKAKLFGDKNE